MHRLQDCRQFTDYMARYFRLFYLQWFSTSPQFIFGVDAAPAALIGSALLTLHVENGSKEAMAVVPVLTLFVALWLLAFYVMRAENCKLYLCAGHGRLYHGNLYHDHPDAGAEINGWYRRNR